MTKKARSKPQKRQPLTDGEIVTKPGHGRRSALAVIGGVFAGAAALVSGAKPAHADSFDTTIRADPAGDSDSGRFADPAEDDDMTIPADSGGGGGDTDVSSVADPADNDSGRSSDPGDNDVTSTADPGGGSSSDADPDDATGRGIGADYEDIIFGDEEDFAGVSGSANADSD